MKNVDIFEPARGRVRRENGFLFVFNKRNTPPPPRRLVKVVVVVVVAGWLVGWLAGMGMVIGFDYLRLTISRNN